MSYSREEGKDQIFFVTKEDYEKPTTALVTTKNDDEDDEEPGLIFKDGTINWNCPCLGGMAAGPCGVPFRDAFSCFHYSDVNPKGSECFDSFKKMQDCMSEYPELYPKDETKDPLADAPDKPEEKIESSSPEITTGADTSSEAASTEPEPEVNGVSEAVPTELETTELSPDKVEEKIVPEPEANGISEATELSPTELSPDKPEEKIVPESSSPEPITESDSISEAVLAEEASTEQLIEATS